MDVASILLSARSPDHTTRTNAEKVLKDAEEKNFSVYLVTLTDHLAGNDNNPESRRLAGLIIKNTLHSRDTDVRAHLTKRWLHSVDEQSKNHIRNALLRALAASAPEPRRAAAQVIAKLAAIDVTRPGAWDSLINDLLSACNAADDHVKQASLEALGYICEEASSVSDKDMESALAGQSNQILTAVVQGMAYTGSPNSTKQSVNSVRLAATVALNNTIEFAKTQFTVPAERDAIVNTLCQSARSDDENIRQAAFEGLVKVSENYYDKLHEYIQAIYSLTEHAIRNDIEPVAMQAIEIWSTVAEEEAAINLDNELFQGTGKTSDRASRQFVERALPYLSGPLFDSLKKQEDDPLEDSTWNIATAAGSCLELLASAAPNTILDVVKPFVEANIRDQANWRSREAAILAFGSVVEGPSPHTVQPLIKDAMQVLIDTLRYDSNLAVRDTTAWTLGRAISVDKDSTLAHLRLLIESLRSALAVAENPLFAAHICGAIHNIGESFVEESFQNTGAMTEFVDPLVHVLTQTAERGDANESNLRTCAYEAISMLFRCLPEDGVPIVEAWLPSFIEKLQATLRMVSNVLSEEELHNLVEQQGVICGVLATATGRFSKKSLMQYADVLMEIYLATFKIPPNGGSAEDSFLAVGALADTIGSDFRRYMDYFVPELHRGLSNVAQWQVCAVTVGVTVELSRALGKDLNPYSEKIMYLLLEAVKSRSLDKSVKPSILLCFGEVAMAIKGDFVVYLNQVMDCLREAAVSSVETSVSPDDYDMLDWVQQLQESVLEAYVSILNGLRDESKQEALIPYFDWVSRFCEVLYKRQAENGPWSNEMIKQMASLVVDVLEALPQLRDVLEKVQWVSHLIDVGPRSSDGRTRELGEWAQQAILFP